MTTLQTAWGSLILGWSLGMALMAIKTGHPVDRWAAGALLAAGILALVTR